MPRFSSPIVDGSRLCHKCGENKPISGFFISRKNIHGIRSNCKSCDNIKNKEYRDKNREQLKARHLKWYHAQKGRADGGQNNRRLIRRYGITWREYEIMLAAQLGGCAVCGASSDRNKRLSVDHCHSTGKVRGLLCHRCNISLGLFKDDAARLRRAADYIDGKGNK